MASYIRLTEQDDAGVPTPPSGKVNIFVDDTTHEPSYKNAAGTVTSLKGEKGDTGAGVDELTTKGDLLGFDGSDPDRLAVGTDGQVLTADSNESLGVKWATLAASDVGAIAASTLSSKGDLISYTGAALAALGVGTDNQVLTADSNEATGLKWATPASGFVDPLTTKGDIMVYGTSTTRLGVGTDGYVLSADSSEATGLKWVEATGGGGGSVSWGGINGTLGDQTDLQNALDAKQDELTGLTASVSELNILDGATLSTTELNYVDGVTSAIQTQLDAKAALTTALGTVNHGSTAATARPSGYTAVQWVGSVEPENKVSGDIWLDTSGA